MYALLEVNNSKEKREREEVVKGEISKWQRGEIKECTFPIEVKVRIFMVKAFQRIATSATHSFRNFKEYNTQS